MFRGDGSVTPDQTCCALDFAVDFRALLHCRPPHAHDRQWTPVALLSHRSLLPACVSSSLSLRPVVAPAVVAESTAAAGP